MSRTITEPLQTLLPVIAAHRDEADKARRLSDEVYAALRSSGLLGMPIGQDRGGLGTTLPDMLNVFESIAYEDTAVSWVVWNAGLVGFYVRYMPEPLRQELFAGGQNIICQSTIPAGEIDFRGGQAQIRGRWPLMSGSPGADWAVLTCRRLENREPCLDASGLPQTVLAALPMAETTLIDTWHTSGLRGTGSHDIEVDGAIIPDHRIFEVGGDMQVTSPTDRLPIFACVEAIFAAQLLGLGYAVYDFALERGRTAITPGPMPDPRDRQDYQIAIAQHGAALQASSAQLETAAKDVWAVAESGAALDQTVITNLYAASFTVIDTVKASVEAFHALSGTSGLYEHSPIEKRARDLHAMLRHIVAQPLMRADIGRVHLGLEPDWPLFFV